MHVNTHIHSIKCNKIILKFISTHGTCLTTHLVTSLQVQEGPFYDTEINGRSNAASAMTQAPFGLLISGIEGLTRFTLLSLVSQELGNFLKSPWLNNV